MGALFYNSNDPSFQSDMSSSELRDVHINSVTNNVSNSGFILSIPLKVNGNSNYIYTLTLPIDNTAGANNFYIYGWNGVTYTINLLQAVYNFPTGYKKVKFTFRQINASQTTVLFTRTDIGATAFTLLVGNVVTLNSGNLEIYFRLENTSVPSDLKSSYYVLSLGNAYFNF